VSLLGRAALLLALAGAIYVIGAALYSRRPGRRAFAQSAERGVMPASASPRWRS
jgi:hypothetical protein